MTPTMSLSARSARWRDVGFALLSAMIAVAIAIIVIGPAARQLEYPLLYSGDGLNHGLLIKSIVDTGWYLELSRVGAPFSASFLSYPIDEGFHLLMLKLLAAVTGSYAASFNLFYLGSFATIAVAGYFVLRLFGISQPLAVAGAVTYAILPYHFLRLPHLFLASYVSIPIAVALAHWSWAWGTGNSLPMSSWKRVALIVGAIIVGSAGVYYAAFACLMFTVSAVSAMIFRSSARSALASIGLMCLVVFVVAANLAPHLIHSLKAGTNVNAANARNPIESEIHSLRPTLLILPTPGHRWSLLAKIGDHYSSTMVAVHENRSAALGTLGAVGLIVLLAVAWRRLASNEQNALENDAWLSTQALMAIAVGTFGGLGTFFAFFVSSALRGYNRISVVISFLATVMLLIWIQRWVYRKWSGRAATIAASGIAVAITLFAAWDQTSGTSRANDAQIQATWRSDANFVRDIESTLALDAAILVWPYLRFPEQPPVFGEGPSGLLRLPLHAQRSRWSYGAMAGSEGDRWLSALATMPLAVVPTIAGRSGLSGIVVARIALKDGGREADAVFAAMLGPAKLSSDGSFAFYRVEKTGNMPLPTSAFSAVLTEAMTGEQYETMLLDGIAFGSDDKHRAMVVAELKGFSAQESWGRWTDANLADRGTIKLHRSLPTSGNLLMRIRCFAASCNGKLRARYGGIEHVIDLRGITEQDVSLPMHADGGTEIELIPANPASPRSVAGTNDDRVVGVGIMSMRWLKAALPPPRAEQGDQQRSVQRVKT